MNIYVCVAKLSGEHKEAPKSRSLWTWRAQATGSDDESYEKLKVDDLLNYFQVSNHAVRGEMSRISFGRHGPHE